MAAPRLLVFPVLVFVAACATTGTTPRATLTPNEGPRARISASHDGGLTNRSLRTSFRVEQDAYVMVGHLGGNGRITVLYPASAYASTWVKRNKTYQVPAFDAKFDGVPQLFSYATRAYRSPSARMASYDGRGNGFVFLVASQYPLSFDDLTTDGLWDEYEVEDYGWSSDPRYAVHDFALHVARGLPFTLDYADSFGMYAMNSCSISGFSSNFGLWGPGAAFIPGIGWWSGGMLMSSWSYFLREPMFFTHGYPPFNPSCYGARRSYAMYCGAAPWSWCSRANNRYAWAPPRLDVPMPPTTPRSPLAPPGLGRRFVGVRNGSESGPAVSLTRPRFSPRPTTPSVATPSSPTRPNRTVTNSGERAGPRGASPETFRPREPSSSPRANSPSSSGSGRVDAPRSAPVTQAPRFSPPPTASAPASPSPRVEAPHPPKPREP